MHNARIISLSRPIGRDVDIVIEGFKRSGGSKGFVSTAGETLVIISGILCRFQVSETGIFSFL